MPKNTAPLIHSSNYRVVFGEAGVTSTPTLHALANGKFYFLDSSSLYRFNSDGTLDSTFAVNGVVSLPDTLFIAKMSIDASGNITVAADEPNITGDFALLKYDVNGVLDQSFGDNGKVVLDVGDEKTNNATNDSVFSVAADHLGNIFVLGYSSAPLTNTGTDAALAAFSATGSLISSFSENGRVLTHIGADDLPRDMAIMGDGRIVVVGDTGSDNPLLGNRPFLDSLILRYNSDGSLDNTFNGNGVLVKDFGVFDLLIDVEVLSNGKILVTGSSLDTNFHGGLLVARINSDGTVDSSFGGAGTGYAVVDDLTVGNDALIVLPDGSFIVGATAPTGTPLNDGIANKVQLLKFNADGSRDLSFGELGIASADIANGGFLANIALTSDGKILVTTAAQFFVGILGKELHASVLMRFNPDGSLDKSFAPLTYKASGTPVILDPYMEVADVDVLFGSDRFPGASVTVQRSGGAVSTDVFGSALISGSAVVLAGKQVATVSESGNGRLTLVFTEDATSVDVSTVLRSLTFANDKIGSGVVSIEVEFSDGNSNNIQGEGPALTASTTIDVLVSGSAVKHQSPSGKSAAFTTEWDAPFKFKEKHFGFSDPDGDRFAGIIVETLPESGQLLLANKRVSSGEFVSLQKIIDGKFSFRPGIESDDSFTFKVRDDGEIAGGGSNTDPKADRISLNRDGDDVMRGTARPDVFQGGGGNDKLNGLGGADTINGGKGKDVLTGGKGADRFEFGKRDGSDVITDFAATGAQHDILDLRDNRSFSTFKDLIANHTSELGSSLVITDGHGFSLKLLGVELRDLGPGDVLI